MGLCQATGHLRLRIRAADRLSDLRFNTRRNLQYILELMASGTMDLGPIISHRLPATKMRYAYELAVKHSKELVAAIFKWEGSE